MSNDIGELTGQVSTCPMASVVVSADCLQASPTLLNWLTISVTTHLRSLSHIGILTS